MPLSCVADICLAAIRLPDQNVVMGIARIGRLLLAAALGVGLTAPVAAAEFRLELLGDRLLKARNGIVAADSRTSKALVRVISPGSSISKFGTVRVLVMNLGSRAFSFGPEDVAIMSESGAAFPVVNNDRLDTGYESVKRETARQRSVTASVNRSLSSLAEAASVGVRPQTPVPTVAGSGAGADSAARLDRSRGPGEAANPGILDALTGTLGTFEVPPQDARGGYLLFEIPKSLRSSKTSQPLTLVVTVAGEEHRFPALLKRR